MEKKITNILRVVLLTIVAAVAMPSFAATSAKEDNAESKAMLGMVAQMLQNSLPMDMGEGVLWEKAYFENDIFGLDFTMECSAKDWKVVKKGTPEFKETILNEMLTDDDTTLRDILVQTGCTMRINFNRKGGDKSEAIVYDITPEQIKAMSK